MAGHIFQHHCWYGPTSFPLWPCTTLCLEFSSSPFHWTSTFLSSKSVLMAFLSSIILLLFLLPTPPSLSFLIFMTTFDSFLFYLASLHFLEYEFLIQISLESKFHNGRDHVFFCLFVCFREFCTWVYIFLIHDCLSSARKTVCWMSGRVVVWELLRYLADSLARRSCVLAGVVSWLVLIRVWGC